MQWLLTVFAAGGRCDHRWRQRRGKQGIECEYSKPWRLRMDRRRRRARCRPRLL